MQTDYPNKKEKKCFNCQKEFNCYQENCWCSVYPNVLPVIKSEDCLCSGCLRKKIKRKNQKLI